MIKDKFKFEITLICIIYTLMFVFVEVCLSKGDLDEGKATLYILTGGIWTLLATIRASLYRNTNNQKEDKQNVEQK